MGDRIIDVTCPIFVIHGTCDVIVPFSHGEVIQEKIRKCAKTTPFWAQGMGHNDIEVNMTTEFLQSLRDFINYAMLTDQYKTKKSQLMKKQAERTTNVELCKPEKLLHRSVSITIQEEKIEVLKESPSTICYDDMDNRKKDCDIYNNTPYYQFSSKHQKSDSFISKEDGESCMVSLNSRI